MKHIDALLETLLSRYRMLFHHRDCGSRCNRHPERDNVSFSIQFILSLLYVNRAVSRSVTELPRLVATRTRARACAHTHTARNFNSRLFENHDTGQL